MTIEKREYEVMVIFKPLLPDDVRKGAHQSIVDLAKKLKGKVNDADVWGKRYLSYPIASHQEGYYIVYQVVLPSESLEKLKTGLERVSEILRFMITKIGDPEEKGDTLNKKEIEI
ncbi:MAG: 30S ribosomal protein S6 [bacterium]